jgi:pyruvate/2-oxoglutarate dehydrogenase complex dihydrolipoamide dehydrogenase (E3) component
MEEVKNIVIGFGKAGKTLAQDLGSRGESTILVEKDPKMYGGTCINVACIPSKKLATLAKQKPENANNTDYYTNAIQEKKSLIEKLNASNYDNVNDNENTEVIDGEASFLSENQIQITQDTGKKLEYQADRIFINTGSRPNMPPVDGLEINGQTIHTSETLMDDEEFPEKLTIIGDGNIGLEFASIYTQFGSEVTVISENSRAEFLAAQDEDVAKTVLQALEDMGIEFIFDANTTSVKTENDQVTLTYEQGAATETLATDKVLVAIGRHPNIDSLNLDAAGIELSEDGSIEVNKHLQTNLEHIYAMGDVKGGLEHTYISLDDYRIVLSHLFEGGTYSLDDRKYVPFATFINPTLSSAGLTEKKAKEEGYNTKVASLPASSIPRAKVHGNQVGMYKAVVDADTEQILGTVLFGETSEEVINIVTTAMKARLSYKDLASHVFTHPAMAEALNDLYGAIE